MSFKEKNENVFVITINGYDDTIGIIIQTNLSQAITESSVLSTCGYKKRHPLNDYVDFYVSLNPDNKIFDSSNDQKIIAIIQTFQEACGNLIECYSVIKKQAEDNL